MRTLVTGATGTVGGAIVQQLLGAGREVRVLVRDVARAKAILPAGIELVAGDVTDAASVTAAVAGCAAVFHTAGLPEQWLRDPARFTEVNVGGSSHVGEAALAAGVQAFVYTSTIDVLEWKRGEAFDERTLATAPKGSYYERSKQEADRAMVALQERGLPVRYAHPAAVFGDAPALTPGLNDLLVRLLRGKVPMILPGGIPVVLSEDVARGHLLLERAPVGARAIFSERFVSLVELAQELVRAAGRGKVPRVLPVWLAKLVSVTGEGLAKLTRRPPLIPAGQLQFLLEDVHPSAEWARRELGWVPVPFAEAMTRAVAAFRARGWWNE
ncbi:MAG: NAD-dependent epimerase/dehydratase family protein [Kofleriaceae bacterium]|nr:MAG: NAD-dependent epimerase/dehydratase family protein [Kofleriaceae bacterium]MBZ0238805.1 NAD-dependent epimerase/dehydratase family protein [Kofleriaceae bacterium]